MWGGSGLIRTDPYGSYGAGRIGDFVLQGDYIGSIRNQSDLDSAQVRRARRGGFLSTTGSFQLNSGGGRGVAPGQGPRGSDRRLKKNIKLVGTSKSGLNIYHFNYKKPEIWGHDTFSVVMAQEVPFASVKGTDGFYRVNYDLIDVDFKRVA